MYCHILGTIVLTQILTNHKILIPTDSRLISRTRVKLKQGEIIDFFPFTSSSSSRYLFSGCKYTNPHTISIVSPYSKSSSQELTPATFFYHNHLVFAAPRSMEGHKKILSEIMEDNQK